LSNTSVFDDDDDSGGIVSTREQILLYPSLEVKSGYDTTQSNPDWICGQLAICRKVFGTEYNH
jgi:hypothetical protein